MYESDFVEAGFSELLNQATDTATTYFSRAIKVIDSEFGEGYSAKNPDLVAAFMKTACADYNTAATAKVLGASAHLIAEGLQAIAREV
jgi:hypothetical protein